MTFILMMASLPHTHKLRTYTHKQPHSHSKKAEIIEATLAVTTFNYNRYKSTHILWERFKYYETIAMHSISPLQISEKSYFPV